MSARVMNQPRSTLKGLVAPRTALVLKVAEQGRAIQGFLPDPLTGSGAWSIIDFAAGVTGV